MIKLFFRLKIIYFYLKKHYFLNIFIVLSFSIAILFPCLILSTLEYNNKSLDLSMKENDSTIFVDFVLNKSYINEIDKKIREENILSFKKAYVSSTVVRMPILVNNESVLAHVKSVNNLEYYNPNSLIHGRFPDDNEFKNNQPYAMVSLNYFQKNNIKLGDSVNVRGYKLEIIGVLIEENTMLTVLVPKNILKEITQKSYAQYRLKILPYETFDKRYIEEELSSILPYAEILQVKNKEENMAFHKAGYDYILKYNLIQGSFIILFSIISLLLISIARLFKKKHIIGIEMTLGMSRKDIILDSYMETLFLMFIALVIDLVIIYYFQNIFTYITPILFTKRLVINSLILITIFAFIIGVISGIFTTKDNISELINN